MTDCYGQPLLDAVLREASSPSETLDEAVRRVLRTKFELGLFEQPYVDVSLAEGANDTRAQRDLARRIARKSLVLLRNDGALPLPSDLPLRGRYRAWRRPGAHISSATTPTRLTSSRSRDVLERPATFPDRRRPVGPRSPRSPGDAPSVLDALRAGCTASASASPAVAT